MNLKDAKILITGGSLGIGKATAKLLLASGAKVAITARQKVNLERTAKEIGAFPIHADVANQEDIERIFTEFLAEFGTLDALINNAGVGLREKIDRIQLSQFERIFSVNVFGTAMMGKHAARIFMERGSGTIINIGSTSSNKGFENGTIYAASKFALRGMTECWRTELRKHNVRVMLINPSEVTTAFDNPLTREERPEQYNRLRPMELAHAIKSALEMDDRGFIPELQVWATNPFD